MLNVHAPARPAYRVQLSDLCPAVHSCAFCGLPKPGVVPVIPEGQSGGADQAGPSYEELGDMTRYILPHSRAFPCPSCALKHAVARLFPRKTPHPFENPLAAELRAMKAEPAPARLGAPVMATPNALAVLFKIHHPRATELAGVSGSYELGAQYLPAVLDRFEAHDWGLAGTLAEADATLGAEQGVLACEADRNAASVAANAGPVRGVFVLSRTTPGGWSNGGHLAEQTALATLTVHRVLPDRLTLIATPDDGVD